MRVIRQHGLSRTPEYRVWQTMRHRCTSPASPAWPNYGGRGITICDRWLDDPAAFLSDMGPRPSPKHEIDRIDNNGPYSPANCRWTTRKVNDRNRRNNRRIEHHGENLTISEWSERTGISTHTILKRLDLGWPGARALSTSTRAKRRNGSSAERDRKPCIDCGKPIRMKPKRCITCSNKARAASLQAKGGRRAKTPKT